MSVVGIWQDVIFLAAVRAMSVSDEAQILEHIERPIHGGGRRRRVGRAASIEQLGTRHVALALGQDVDEGPPLWRPAHAPLVQALPNRVPGRRGGPDDR